MKFFVIIQDSPPGTPASERLFWNNHDGFADRASADKFSEEEMQTLRLPIGGRWVKARKK